MRLEHEDKALGPKLSPAAEAELARQMSKFIYLTDEERNEIGLRVARAASARSQPTWWAAGQAAAAPTEAEDDELAAAKAAHDALVAKREEARAQGREAEAEVHRALESGEWLGARDPAAAAWVARAQAEFAVADENFRIATLEADMAEKAWARVNGKIRHNCQARYNAFVGRGFR